MSLTLTTVNDDTLAEMNALIAQDSWIVYSLQNLPIPEVFQNPMLQAMIIDRCAAVVGRTVKYIGITVMTGIVNHFNPEKKVSTIGDVATVPAVVQQPGHGYLEWMASTNFGGNTTRLVVILVLAILLITVIIIFALYLCCTRLPRLLFPNNPSFSPSIILNQYNGHDRSYNSTPNSPPDHSVQSDRFVRVNSHVRRRPQRRQ